MGGDRKKARSAAIEAGHTNRAAAETSDAMIRFKGSWRVFLTLRKLIEVCRSVASITTEQHVKQMDALLRPHLPVMRSSFRLCRIAGALH